MYVVVLCALCTQRRDRRRMSLVIKHGSMRTQHTPHTVAAVVPQVRWCSIQQALTFGGSFLYINWVSVVRTWIRGPHSYIFRSMRKASPPRVSSQLEPVLAVGWGKDYGWGQILVRVRVGDRRGVRVRVLGWVYAVPRFHQEVLLSPQKCKVHDRPNPL